MERKVFIGGTFTGTVYEETGIPKRVPRKIKKKCRSVWDKVIKIEPGKILIIFSK